MTQPSGAPPAGDSPNFPPLDLDSPLGGNTATPPSSHPLPGSVSEPETYPIPGGLSGWSPRELGSEPKPVASHPTTAAQPLRVEPRGRSRSPQKAGGDPGLWWELAGYNALVFLGSVCVMTLELTASRLIAKHVGSSLYTWTSVIGVVLAGITLGNYLGGWLADRYDRARALSWMFLIASLSCASVLWLDLAVGTLPRPETVNWPTWVVCVVSMIFLHPAIALGATSPIVASMALERTTSLGATVGNVYAWGALGSIVGTFLTGFYLIDVWGTRSIVGLTAGVLALLAVIVAGHRWVFRTAVVCGWLQLLAGLLAASSITTGFGAEIGESVGSVTGWWTTADEREPHRARWRMFGANLATKVQEIGLELKLRDDQPGKYYDESSYSYIHVDDDQLEGTPVKYLRLDKLIHSYFDPDNPTALHYEYEQVYAAVTKRAAPAATSDLWVTLPQFIGVDELLRDLPEGVTFEAGSRRLWLTKPQSGVLDELLRRSTDFAYWEALQQLHVETTKPRWGGFATVTLSALPSGVVMPADLFQTVRYDATLEVFTAYEPVTAAIRDRLLQLSPQSAWQQALQTLRSKSAAISTLFVGGGGFIFPRWVLAEFPGATRIDVAELDPAVYRAVQRELGLSSADETRIHTTIGDARNFVEDRFRENQRLVAAGKAPITYDFIYGDAFNDFSIPFHLATVEFTQRMRSLLSETGVLQANVIDIYPRVEVPGTTVGTATLDLWTRPPDAVLAAGTLKERVPRLKPECRPLELQAGATSQWQLKATAEISLAREQTLRSLAPDDAAWATAVNSIAAQTRGRKTLGTALPEALRPHGELERSWVPAGGDFPGVEVYRVGQDRYVLGLRGEVSPSLEQRLLALAPTDKEWDRTIREGARRSREYRGGRFLGRYANTLAAVFPCLYVFSTSRSEPTDDRDTFVVVCSLKPLDLSALETTGYWSGAPFASLERDSLDADWNDSKAVRRSGQMDALLSLADGLILEDDFAPVDNLLRPVFATQD